MYFLCKGNSKGRQTRMSLLQTMSFIFIPVTPVWRSPMLLALLWIYCNINRMRIWSVIISAVLMMITCHTLGFCWVILVPFLEDLSAIKHHLQHHAATLKKKSKKKACWVLPELPVYMWVEVGEKSAPCTQAHAQWAISTSALHLPLTIMGD